MASWHDISRENRLAAGELSRARRWRSSVSRSYYALYAELTGRLLTQGVTLHAARANPSHADLPRMVAGNLAGLDSLGRRRVKRAAERLYRFRVFADYYPGLTVERDESCRALGELHRALIVLGGEGD